MAELSPELEASINKMHKVMIHDFFDGPEAVRGREFVKLLGREPTLSVEAIKIELEEWARKREEILNG